MVADPEAIRRVVQTLSTSDQPNMPEQASPQPPPAFQGDGRRVWILVVQLYAARSRRNWDHGDFTDRADRSACHTAGRPRRRSVSVLRRGSVCAHRPRFRLCILIGLARHRLLLEQ